MRDILYIFVQHVQRMDIAAIRPMLNKEKIYNDLSLDDFIDQLHHIFLYFIEECGDTRLIAEEGCCKGYRCDNFEKKGFTFRGNNSKKYFSLIIDMNGDEIDEISYCNFFKPDFLQELLTLNVHNLIPKHERYSVINDPDYLILKQASDQALKTLTKTDIHHVTPEEISEWIMLNKHLILSCAPYFKDFELFSEFLLVYSKLESLNDRLLVFKEKAVSFNRIISLKLESDIGVQSDFYNNLGKYFVDTFEELEFFNWEYVHRGYLDFSLNGGICRILTAGYEPVFTFLYDNLKLMRNVVRSDPNINPGRSIDEDPGVKSSDNLLPF